MFRKGDKFQGAVTITRLNYVPRNIMLLKTLVFNTTASKQSKAERYTTPYTHTKNFKQEVHAHYWVQMFP